MKYGVAIFPTDYAIRPDEVARAAEERGFESIFFPEHTHIPTSRRTAFPRGGELPREYSHTIDPFVALTMAAAATKTLKLATGICLVIERDPIVQQQVGLCEEWRKANPDTPTTPPAEPWQNEVRDFHGSGSLSGHAWAHLREWWQDSEIGR